MLEPWVQSFGWVVGVRVQEFRVLGLPAVGLSASGSQTLDPERFQASRN